MRENERGVIPFHHDENWLRDHGLNPHMAPGVHVINPEAALVEHKIFEWGPMTMLHELAHAYHIVHLGYDDTNITKSFTRAMTRGLYLKVPDRKDKEKLVKAYAATNKAEYFAEATEAYAFTLDESRPVRIRMRAPRLLRWNQVFGVCICRSQGRLTG